MSCIRVIEIVIQSVNEYNVIQDATIAVYDEISTVGHSMSTR